MMAGVSNDGFLALQPALTSVQRRRLRMATYRKCMNNQCSGFNRLLLPIALRSLTAAQDAGSSFVVGAPTPTQW